MPVMKGHSKPSTGASYQKHNTQTDAENWTAPALFEKVFISKRSHDNRNDHPGLMETSELDYMEQFK